MMRATLEVAVVIPIAVFLVSSPATSETRYAITNLGVLDGHDVSSARAINNAGQVVGYSSDGGFLRHGVLWESGLMTELPVLSGTFASNVTDINEAGDMVGWCYNYQADNGVMWADGVVTELTCPTPPYYSMPQAHGLNDSREVVGWVKDSGLTYSAHWDDFTITCLVARNGSARAINNAGAVVGEMTCGSEYHAFLFEDGALTDLGLLGYYHSNARDINEAGQVVGASWTPTSADRHAALWDNGTCYDLGTFGGNRSQAEAINEWGQIVGFAWTPTARHAFIWDNNVMTDLNDLIEPAGGWELDTAYDINDLGQIVGYGTVGGEQRAFLLTPIPEPATVFIVGGAAVLVGLFRMRRRTRR